MKRFMTGNIMLIACCLFYLAWWLIAFKPEGAVKGMKSGWLLIPAVIFGVGAVLSITAGISSTDKSLMLIGPMKIVAAGVIAYIVLLIATYLLMKRPVTTELFLIVGWATLASCEISALYGRGIYSHTGAFVFIALILILAIISLVCYLLYYNLGTVAGYYDGIIPLAIIAIAMAIMCITMRS